jgi:hypothetical protein
MSNVAVPKNLGKLSATKIVYYAMSKGLTTSKDIRAFFDKCDKTGRRKTIVMGKGTLSTVRSQYLLSVRTHNPDLDNKICEIFDNGFLGNLIDAIIVKPGISRSEIRVFLYGTIKRVLSDTTLSELKEAEILTCEMATTGHPSQLMPIDIKQLKKHQLYYHLETLKQRYTKKEILDALR